MSGGTFDYVQYRIKEIYESIQEELDLMGKDKPREDLWHDHEYYEKHPEELKYEIYSQEVQKIFKDGIKYLKIAEVYAQRIDYFLAGDDGEESLIRRLKEDLSKLPSDTK